MKTTNLIKRNIDALLNDFTDQKITSSKGAIKTYYYKQHDIIKLSKNTISVQDNLTKKITVLKLLPSNETIIVT